MNPFEPDLRWNLFNVDGNITIHSTEHRTWVEDRFVYSTLRAEIVRFETQIVTITGPNWQIVGTLAFHNIIASVEIYPGRSHNEEETCDIRLDHVGIDKLVKLLQFIPLFGNIRVIGRIRQYEGLLSGRNWSFIFKLWVQTLFLEVSERLPFLVPATISGSPLAVQNSFITIESQGPYEEFLYDRWVRTGEIIVSDSGEEFSESD